MPLADQDRSRWDTVLIAEGVAVLQAALARDRLGEYQAQAAIAALHCDAPSAAETDWPQVLEWYDELLRLTDSPVVALNRAVAVGEVDGPHAGLRALGAVPPTYRAEPRSPRGCTSAPATSRTRRLSTPRLPHLRATSPNATTSPDRQPGYGKASSHRGTVLQSRGDCSRSTHCDRHSGGSDRCP